GSARARQRTESRRRPNGLLAARRLLYRRLDRTLRLRAAGRIAASLRTRREARRGYRSPWRRRTRILRDGAVHDVRFRLFPPYDANVRARAPRGAARPVARPAGARSDRGVPSLGRLPRAR